ncbi:MAG: hypothetical protein H8E55_20175 [Pelagibacterales bacterium]|nr:hypothetical protein [Pelagibacterales bacterium]
MKNIIIPVAIFLIIIISLLISSNVSYQEKYQKDNATLIQIPKDNEKLQLEIIDRELTTDCDSYLVDSESTNIIQDTIELGSAEWFPTRSEWTNMSKQEKKNWEKQYDFLNQ